MGKFPIDCFTNGNALLKTAETSALNDEMESIRSEMLRRGVALKIGRNFEWFIEEIEAQPRRHKVAPQFDPDRDLKLSRDAVWVCGHDADGFLVHTQAVQLIKMNGGSLGDFIAKNRFRYKPALPPVKPATVRSHPGPRANALTGKGVYHGEMWLERSLRGGDFASQLNRFGMYLAYKEWEFDFVFGLMSWALACDGFRDRIGYMHGEPLAVVWDTLTSKKQHQVWTVYMERDDIQHLLRLPAVEFSEYIASEFN